MKKRIEEYFDRLWPINRSLTGNGNRETLRILQELIDLKIYEAPSGSQAFDWTIPPEWNAREAWIKDPQGKKIVDFAENNLHLLGYSTPVKGRMSLDELNAHLYSLPDQPDLIPYLTSYYKERWGFCLSHNKREQLVPGDYEVLIDSTLDPKGSMTYADAYLPGDTDREIMFSTYFCHPSLASNELSGPLVAAFIYSELKKSTSRRYSYRFVFAPETIGHIHYLSRNGEALKEKLDAGFIITCIGDAGPFTYKRSRRGNSLADRAAVSVLTQTEKDFIIEDFFPSGSDERQYCSPGFNLPVGSLMRTRYSKYPEYHTSADNKDFISFDAMEASVGKYLEIINVLENNHKFVNTMPDCEPQLGKRGLYPTLGSQKSTRDQVEAMMWLLNLADGDHDLISISERSHIPLTDLIGLLPKLLEAGIIRK